MICGIIIYHPDLLRLRHTVTQLIDKNYKVILFLNSEFPSDGFDDCELLGDGDNQGIGIALNEFVKVAAGQEYILFLDQDTVINECQLEKYQEYMDLSRPFDVLNPRYARDQERYHYFTSGSINRVRFLQDLEGFREDLFIDEVDGDFLDRAFLSNVRICFASEILLEHPLGDKKYRKLFGREFCSDNHNAIRKYYISRNRVYLATRYPNRLGKYAVDSIKKLVMFLVVEDHRFLKLRFIFLGILHGLIGRLGRYD